jgi:hypothetical protein
MDTYGSSLPGNGVFVWRGVVWLCRVAATVGVTICQIDSTTNGDGMYQTPAPFSLEFSATQNHCDLVAIAAGSVYNKTDLSPMLTELIASTTSVAEAHRLLDDLVCDQLDPRTTFIPVSQINPYLVECAMGRLVYHGCSPCECADRAQAVFVASADEALASLGDMPWLFDTVMGSTDRLVWAYFCVETAFVELFGLSSDWCSAQIAYDGETLSFEFGCYDGTSGRCSGVLLSSVQHNACDLFNVDTDIIGSFSLRDKLFNSGDLLEIAVCLRTENYSPLTMTTPEREVMSMVDIVDGLIAVGAKELTACEIELAVALAVDWDGDLSALVTTTRNALAPCQTV